MRRSRRRVLISAVVGLALVATAIAAWPRTADTTPVGSTKGGASSTASAAVVDGTPSISDAEVVQLFARRSAALKRGSLADWLADVDPAQKALVAQQRQLFAGLRLLPLLSYQVTLGARGQHDRYVTTPVPAASATRSPGLRMVYQLRGYDPAPVARDYLPILAERDGHLLIEGDQTATAEPSTPLEPWESGPIAVASGRHALVVVSASDRARLPGMVVRADAAVAWVSRMWPKAGTGRVVLYALRDRAVLARYAVHASAVSDFDGVTVGAYDAATRPAVEGSRVLFNPRYVTPASSAAVLNDLMRHEFTHVAHWNDTHRGTPTWAVEGIAEYTSYRGHPADQRVAADIGKAARAGRLAPTLPRSVGFYDDPRGVHYGVAWLTFQYLSERYGEAKLRRLYDGLSNLREPPDSAAERTAENAVFVRVLGSSETAYVKKLNAWIASVLRPV